MPVSAYSEENLVMPSELYEVANQHQCEAVSDFFNDRSYGTDPPYVYGYLGGYKRDSAIFWCRLMEDKKKYKLIVYSKYPEYVKDFSCPYEIEAKYPVGLAIYENQTISLKEFHYIDDKKPVSEATLKDATLIVSRGAESTGITYLCYQGRWIARYID